MRSTADRCLQADVIARMVTTSSATCCGDVGIPNAANISPFQPHSIAGDGMSALRGKADLSRRPEKRRF